MLRMSIIGLPGAGKSTFFRTLGHHGQEGSLSGKKGAHIATVFVPDPRLDALSAAYKPKKQVNAAIEFLDTTPLMMDAANKNLTAVSLEDARRADSLCLVLGEYEHGDCREQLRFLLSEFGLSDFMTLEKRAERLRKSVQMTKQRDEQLELEALGKLLAALEQERPAREVALTPQEKHLLSGYQILSAKPLLVVLNVAEDAIPQMAERVALYQQQFPELTITAMAAGIESELAQMGETDAAAFMKDLGLHESAMSRILGACFKLLGLQVFFTVGPDECRAWPIPHGSTAFDAAGAIHSDFQKGFIRAMVLSYAAFAAAPTEATFRLHAQQQKREYPMQDGDLVEFRFSVNK